MIDITTEQDEVTYLLPAELGKRLQARARKSTVLKMDNYLELRDFIGENEERIMETGWMKFYVECADWMNLSSETVRKNLTIIRSYPDEQLRKWITHDLSFDHIETANELQNVRECQYDAAQILDAAYQLGGESGKRMTVDEMEVFALGEKARAGGIRRFVNGLLEKLVKFPTKLGWDAEKTVRFTAWIEAGKDFFS